ncbi:MAG: hypothetical protein NTU76_00375 [Candidatus Taylorbacteria bacterium]|nr:hypothetical protein [Candidatus Taylorbacteria bacterium]
MRQNFINQKYSVVFDGYTERHFIKDFERKYQNSWEVTKLSITESLERIYNLSGTKLIDVICISNCDTFLTKFDFKVANTKESAKTSGNRCILDVCNKSLKIRVLLVYGKMHIDRSEHQETLWWKEKIMENFCLCCS